MNNSGPSHLAVPGVGQLPINLELEKSECFNDGARGWRQLPRLNARELAMLALMDLITDKEKWEDDIFDDEKLSVSREAAWGAQPTITFEEQLVQGWGERKVAAMPLISAETWNWCILELREKAAAFKKKGFSAA